MMVRASSGLGYFGRDKGFLVDKDCVGWNDGQVSYSERLNFNNKTVVAFLMRHGFPTMGFCSLVESEDGSVFSYSCWWKHPWAH
ncbi:hypothetical protein L1987_55798 [Smallanthus sonchifolius]|uniref:Uncharacterized protein n=1 Tax=Smallanthus sonchifolius TaxID=185202 RepID=A0ACB9EAZ4_9ASTR|nr:hypothetical protein L1987_55798 [Smallanthus sonchifolius]